MASVASSNRLPRHSPHGLPVTVKYPPPWKNWASLNPSRATRILWLSWFRLPVTWAAASATAPPSVRIKNFTPVPDGVRDTIELSMQLPEDAAGETLAFPVRQTCEVGETNWNQVAEEGEAEPESPAPAIVVTEATGDAHGHGAAPDDAAGDHGDDHAVTAEDTAATAPPSDSDTIARILGIGGLVVGVIGIVLALAARRPKSGA